MFRARAPLRKRVRNAAKNGDGGDFSVSASLTKLKQTPKTSQPDALMAQKAAQMLYVSGILLVTVCLVCCCCWCVCLVLACDQRSPHPLSLSIPSTPPALTSAFASLPSHCHLIDRRASRTRSAIQMGVATGSSAASAAAAADSRLQSQQCSDAFTHTAAAAASDLTEASADLSHLMRGIEWRAGCLHV